MTTTLVDLTPEQFKELLSEFYAEPSKRNKMTEEEVKDLAERINKRIDVPIINETKEEKILIKIVLEIDTFLYNHLPNEFYDLVRSTDKGIDDNEAKRLVRRLTKLANDKIDFPYLPEVAEHFVIKFVIGIVVKAARKKMDFNKARDLSDKMVISETDDDIEMLVMN